MKDFREAVESGIVVTDGAMATVLHQYGAPVRSCTEELVLTNPELVATVHQAYIDAGAMLLQTHTFSAHRTGLERYGLAHEVEAINRAAVRLAKGVAGDSAYVFGTIGSIAGVVSQGMVLDADRREALRSEFREQAEILLEEGVDGLVLETFGELDELLLACMEIRPLSHLPIIATLSPATVGFTRDGVAIDEAFTMLADAGVEVVGLNCELGPSNMLRTYESVAMRPDMTYAAVPNSGLLHVQDGQYTYTGGPDYFAQMGAALVARGVRVVGGCCGTTPEHIRQLVARVQPLEVVPHAVTELSPVAPSTITVTPAVEQPIASVVDMVKSKRTLLVELDPPRTLHMGRYLKAAKALTDAGADMITLNDNTLGRVRVSNMAAASLLKQIGIEPLVHVTCRDRNLIGQQSHLMGLHVLGIHNVLLVTGDPTRYGDLPGATSVFDVSSMELSRMVKRLNEGTAFSGQVLKSPSRFVVGTAFNPYVRHFDKAMERLQRKVDAGADYVMTQPIFDKETMLRVADAVANLGVPVFIGITPLTSERNALFLHHEVPGIEIPQEVLTRMAEASEEEAPEVGLRIAEDLLDVAMDHFQGIYLMTPFLRYELTEQLVRYVRQADAVHA